jgi:hypothetical protein
MRNRPRHLWLVAGATLAMIAVVAAVLLGLGAREHTTSNPPRPSPITASRPLTVPSTTAIVVGRIPTGRPVAAGFLGLSFEFPALAAYAGSNPAAPNAVLEQLIRNLAAGQRPVIRIGGDSTDLTWWPIAHVRRPAGAKYALTRAWLAAAGAVFRDLGARAILGIDLEADSRRIAAAEADALTSSIGPARVEAVELGNEPELYGSFVWDGSGVTGRPRGYDFPAFLRDFSTIGSALPGFPLAGPAVGGPRWRAYVARFLATEPRVRLVTLHLYPLKLCFVPRGEPEYPTIANLLADPSSRGLAQSVASAVRVAHQSGRTLRIDEMNTNSCGFDVGVSDSFASALWVLDALFQMVRVGVDGVNVHTYPGASYALFRFGRRNGRWQAYVSPEYYGLLMFAEATPPGSRLLPISATHTEPGLRAWAVLAPNGQTHVVLINDRMHPQMLAIRGREATGTASFTLLEAANLRATHGVRLGGQSFGSATTTGQLAGSSHAVAVVPTRGEYFVRLPSGSAGLLTLPEDARLSRP